MNDQTEMIIVDADTKHPAEEVKLGSLSVPGPEAVLEQASRIATALAKVINDRQLYSNIQGKKYVRVEGWNTLGALLGILPREVSATLLDDDSYQAVVELIRTSDGMVIGRGSAICSPDEHNWGDRDAYARRSMAITRATGKAFRLGFSWIMTLAGYEPTPWEEMPPEPLSGGSNGSPKPEKSKSVAKGMPKKMVEHGLAETVSEAAALLNQMPAEMRSDIEAAEKWVKQNRSGEKSESKPAGVKHPKEITPAAFWKQVDKVAAEQRIRPVDLRKQANQILADNGGSRVDALETIRRKTGQSEN